MDAMARGFVSSQVERGAVWRLPFTESWFVLTLAALYSCTMVGTMSREQCAEYKFNAAGIYRKYALEAATMRAERRRWAESNRHAALLLSAAMRELRKDEPNAEAFLFALIGAVDALSYTDVHLHLTAKSLQDKDFKAHCQQALIKNEDELERRMGDIRIRWEDYLPLLEEFFRWQAECGIADVAAGIGHDQIREFSRCNIPVKSEAPRKIAENLEYLYGKEKRKV